MTTPIIINIDVPALEPAIRFYTAALGLKHRRTLDDDVAELTGAAATIYLLCKAASRSGTGSASSSSNATGPTATERSARGRDDHDAKCRRPRRGA